MQGANEITSINNQSIENLYLNTIKTDIKTELDKEGYESKKINITADINVENEEAKIEESTLSSGEVNKLKEALAEKYEIEKEKIYINGK